MPKETSTLATLAEFGMPLPTWNEDRARSGPICVNPTNYLYDGANLIDEVDGSGNLLARYAATTDVDEPLSEQRGSTSSYHEQDGLGSVTSLSYSTGTLEVVS